MKNKKWYITPMILFFIVIAAAAFGNALSDSLYSNYFEDAFNISAMQRGFIEIPRELPGMLCVFITAALSFFGDFRIGLIAQVLSFAGLFALGMLSPTYGVMLLLLFINSMGMHLFMPLQDSLGMKLAEHGKVGKRMGQYSSVKSAVVFAGGILTYFGFHYGFFSFKTHIITVFLIGAGAFAIAAVANIFLIKEVKPPKGEKKKFKILFRKEYKYYYLLTILNGVQKQIAIVYGTWVIVNILKRGADIVSLLLIVANFIGIFTLRKIGKWIDRFGIKRMMYVDALTFIVTYILYGFAVAMIVHGTFEKQAFYSGLVIYIMFILDRISMQFGMVKSLYMKYVSLSDEDVTSTLTMGTTLDHVVSISAAVLSGMVWTYLGPEWVFFTAAFVSLGNIFAAYKVRPEAERARALEVRAQAAMDVGPSTSDADIEEAPAGITLETDAD